MRNRLCLSLAVLTFVFSLAGGWTEAKTPEAAGEQKEMTMHRKLDLKLNYLLYLPKDYSQDKAWPLVIFLHGMGERGSNLDLLKVNGLPKLAAEGREFDFIVASPQCPDKKWWVGMDSHIIALIDELTEKYKVDVNRIYLTGLSMGGYGTWSIGAGYPERFAAIVPICGGGRPFLAQHLKDVPVWAFHGVKDNVVPPSESQQMVDAVNRSGGQAKLTLYPQAGHDSWTQAYNDPELYTWLLSQQKNKDK